MFKQLALVSLAVSSAYGHAFVNSVQGANGISAVGLGVTFNGEVSRNGTVEQPFQLDTPVLKDTATNPCGATLIAGSVNIASSMAAVAKAFGGVPTIPSNGSITFGIHQVNADGGGPFAAEINTDATGGSWSTIEVLSQPPGVNGALHNGPADSFITVQIPTGTTCTGTGSTCLIRLNNGGTTASIANGAGPFGGCVAVAQDATTSTSTTGTSTAKTTGKKTKANKAGRTLLGRHFYTTAERREAAVSLAERTILDHIERELSPLFEKRDLIERQINEKRQILSTQLLDELSTVTGTAIDIVVDRLAGHDDAAVKGGNSTAAAKGSTLTTQQAIDLKKALGLAVNQATGLLASSQVDAGATGTDSAITDKANADANAAQAAGTTSINAGNAGVGAFNTENVNSLLGQLRTATNALVEASATGTVAQASVTAAATATTTATSTRGRKGKGRAGAHLNNANARMERRFRK